MKVSEGRVLQSYLKFYDELKTTVSAKNQVNGEHRSLEDPSLEFGHLGVVRRDEPTPIWW